MDFKFTDEMVREALLEGWNLFSYDDRVMRIEIVDDFYAWESHLSLEEIEKLEAESKLEDDAAAIKLVAAQAAEGDQKSIVALCIHGLEFDELSVIQKPSVNREQAACEMGHSLLAVWNQKYNPFKGEELKQTPLAKRIERAVEITYILDQDQSPQFLRSFYKALPNNTPYDEIISRGISYSDRRVRACFLEAIACVLEPAEEDWTPEKIAEHNTALFDALSSDDPVEQKKAAEAVDGVVNNDFCVHDRRRVLVQFFCRRLDLKSVQYEYDFVGFGELYRRIRGMSEVHNANFDELWIAANWEMTDKENLASRVICNQIIESDPLQHGSESHIEFWSEVVDFLGKEDAAVCGSVVSADDWKAAFAQAESYLQNNHPEMEVDTTFVVEFAMFVDPEQAVDSLRKRQAAEPSLLLPNKILIDNPVHYTVDSIQYLVAKLVTKDKKVSGIKAPYYELCCPLNDPREAQAEVDKANEGIDFTGWWQQVGSP